MWEVTLPGALPNIITGLRNGLGYGVLCSRHAALGILNDLKALGVHLAIDDFGTGFSSLQTLRDYPIDFDMVSESVEISIENDRVKQAMEQLTELQRQAVSLAYYGGYTHSEVSTMLHVPIGTVKTRLRDGMIRLRDELGVGS